MNKDIPPITDYSQAKQYLFYLLSRREYSQHELQNKLDNRLCPAQISQSLLAEFADNNWQSDHRFALSLLKAKAGSGYGPKVIQQLFYQHKIKADLNSLTEEAEIDWQQVVNDCYERKFRQKPIKDFKDKQKRYRFLYSRGFDSDFIQQVFSSFS
ncbi:recombination regulator RecX [Catenovulum sp. 2E275]|uniref:regulatory protein RecX n=1 Tax=Catenovulum sp. 2E275 TaxID=2980497 RepID=UPI0021D00CB8|nr:regulatory protein RecX [Catenovulum sp. 2E275]MCU4675768.1 recombination regulator RecX [Catenovulum sp. 2E275]